jgi:hypothetical protein
MKKEAVGSPVKEAVAEVAGADGEVEPIDFSQAKTTDPC